MAFFNTDFIEMAFFNTDSIEMMEMEMIEMELMKEHKQKIKERPVLAKSGLDDYKKQQFIKKLSPEKRKEIEEQEIQRIADLEVLRKKHIADLEVGIADRKMAIFEIERKREEYNEIKRETKQRKMIKKMLKGRRFDPLFWLKEAFKC